MFFPIINKFIEDNNLILNLDMASSYSPSLDATYFGYEILLGSKNPAGELVFTKRKTLVGETIFTHHEHELYGPMPELENLLFDYFLSTYVIDNFPHMEAWAEAHGLRLDEANELQYEIYREKNEQLRKFFPPKIYKKAAAVALPFFEAMRQI